MRKIVTFLVLFSLGIMSAARALAAGSWSAAPATITNVIVQDPSQDPNSNISGIWVTFSTPPFPLASINCSVHNGWYELGGTSDNVRNLFSTLTAAKLAGRQVSILWNGCTLGGANGYPVITGINY